MAGELRPAALALNLQMATAFRNGKKINSSGNSRQNRSIIAAEQGLEPTPIQYVKFPIYQGDHVLFTKIIYKPGYGLPTSPDHLRELFVGIGH